MCEDCNKQESEKSFDGKALFNAHYESAQENMRQNNASLERLIITISSGSITLLCSFIKFIDATVSFSLVIGISFIVTTL